MTSENSENTPQTRTQMRLMRIAKKHSSAVRKRKFRHGLTIAGMLLGLTYMASAGTHVISEKISQYSKNINENKPIETWLRSVSKKTPPARR